jgi:hypothetical protein
VTLSYWKVRFSGKNLFYNPPQDMRLTFDQNALAAEVCQLAREHQIRQLRFRNDSFSYVGAIPGSDHPPESLRSGIVDIMNRYKLDDLRFGLDREP